MLLPPLLPLPTQLLLLVLPCYCCCCRRRRRCLRRCFASAAAVLLLLLLLPCSLLPGMIVGPMSLRFRVWARSCLPAPRRCSAANQWRQDSKTWWSLIVSINTW
jgi:hypothetical protein